MAITQATLGTTSTTLYTSVGNTAITVISFCNTSAGPVIFDLHVVPDGGTLAGTNIVYKTVSVSATDTYIIDTERYVLGNGDSIRAFDDTGAVMVATVSYVSL